MNKYKAKRDHIHSHTHSPHCSGKCYSLVLMETQARPMAFPHCALDPRWSLSPELGCLESVAPGMSQSQHKESPLELLGMSQTLAVSPGILSLFQFKPAASPYLTLGLSISTLTLQTWSSWYLFSQLKMRHSLSQVVYFYDTSHSHTLGWVTFVISFILLAFIPYTYIT